MTLDELISALLEARDHYTPGKSQVKIDLQSTCNGAYIMTHKNQITNVGYDSKGVTLNIEDTNA